MVNILYISYTGLLDPLGQSQVLQYVRELAREHSISLLTFEKPAAMQDKGRLDALEVQLKSLGINWKRLTYHSKPGIPATVYDVIVGIRTAIGLARRSGAQVVHCRSYIAGVMGLAVKRATGARYIFDMRGFWPDERVDGGIWRKEQLRYKLFKRVERALFSNADHVVSLTKAGVREYEKFDYLKDALPQSSVIPTCTNLDLFTLSSGERQGFTLGYVGTVGSWYLFDEVAATVARVFDRRPDARFLVINKGGHAVVQRDLEAAGVDMARVEIRAAAYDEVSTHIGRMDAGIFYIKPAWSKRASCPTRMGEFLACGKPCLSNGGVGDVYEDFSETGTGVTLPVDGDGNLVMDDLDAALDRLFALAAEPGIAERCRAVAENRFSLAHGVEEYDRIYRRLAS